jgi:hypothetical protein
MSELENWIKSNYDRSELINIVNYGCSAGVNGLIYYHQTSAVFDKISEEIWNLVNETSTDFGYKNIFEFLASLNGSKDVYNQETFKNLLVWLSVETIANQLISEEEESDENEEN